jgi:DNA-binding transcriptional regulator YhcF (GntR family)
MTTTDVCENRHGGAAASVAAFDKVRTTLTQHQERVLRAIEAAEAKGLSCKELAARWSVGMNVISGRFTELKKAGRIEAIGRWHGSTVWRAKRDE